MRSIWTVKTTIHKESNGHSHLTIPDTHQIMDPVSFAASLVTLLGLAGAAAKSVYSFLLDIHDVPDELRSQALKLRFLHQILSVLIAFYEPMKTSTQLHLDPFLEDHLRRFLIEIQVLENSLKEHNLRLSGSGRQHLWERLKWLFPDRELRKFFASLDDWMHIFSMAVAITNMFVYSRACILTFSLSYARKLSSRIVEQATSAYSLLSTMQTQQRLISSPNTNRLSTIINTGPQKLSTISAPTPDQGPILPHALRVYLSQRREPAALKVRYRYKYESKALWADVRAGNTIMRSWSDKGRATYSTVPWKDSACLVMTFSSTVVDVEAHHSHDELHLRSTKSEP
jgi:hypothetical protein